MSMFGNNYNNNSNSFSGSQIGGGGGGGGGFMNNNENFNSSNKQSGNNNNRAIIPYDQRKLSQITIKQIKTASPPQPEQVGVFIDNVEVSQISIVAQIQSLDIQSSHTTLTINDFSGSLQAKKWTNDDQQGMQQNDDSINLTLSRMQIYI